MSGSRGTGFIFDWVISGKKIKFVMTCAHVVCSEKYGSLVFHDDITCYTMWQGMENWARKYRIVKSIVHPAYDGSPATGFDYAIGILGEEEQGNAYVPDSEIKDDFFVAQVSDSTMSVLEGTQGLIQGYPGSWDTTMVKHAGEFMEPGTTRKGQYTGIRIRYNIDQS